jgi:uncharacterized membrane-anchored protein YhcB (DUF1043 family)
MEFVVAVAIGVIVGLIVGWLLFRTDKKGEETNAALESEMKDYRAKVDAHFAETGRLTHELTENYRKMYKHMASGAMDLCDGQESQALLAFSGENPGAVQSAPAPTGYGKDDEYRAPELAPVSINPESDNPPPDIPAERDDFDGPQESLRTVNLDQVAAADKESAKR